ncbi:hypothetical protein E0H86_13455 [Acinetobacter sp. ANC 4635]|uniref:hypothetical protein n=1 Tax=Acinetobacter sp. ANC 4635 TaxID=2529846 RepID=UPI00103EF5D7|nr:hypothetical protein [Acinetobacter sp. ANC 4635]TCB26596.1 hypothetical protein E0H86_13455 [Acinetobacter sp. ANC 4635]
MKNLIAILICLNLFGCTQFKQENFSTCQRLAESYLNTQAVEAYHLVTAQQEKQSVRLYYRLQQSYKIAQTEPKIFECIEKPQGTWLQLLQNGEASTVLVLPRAIK